MLHGNYRWSLFLPNEVGEVPRRGGGVMVSRIAMTPPALRATSPRKTWGGNEGSLNPDHLARVHDVLRVERALDRAHGVELDAAAVVGEFVDLELSDAVLGRDRAAIGHDDIVDGPADGLAVRHEALLVPARRRLTVEVNIA